MFYANLNINKALQVQTLSSTEPNLRNTVISGLGNGCRKTAEFDAYIFYKTEKESFDGVKRNMRRVTTSSLLFLKKQNKTNNCSTNLR